MTSCLTNRKLKDPAPSYRVRAQPGRSGALLEKNRRINRCEFVIRDAALGYDGDTVSFGVHDNLFMCKLSEFGDGMTDITVPAVTVAGVMNAKGTGIAAP